MTFDPTKPYNDLPLLPPPVELETRPVMKLCIEARAAIADLRRAGLGIPDQAVLINTIPLLEAQASSEIENIVTTTDKLFRFAEASERQMDAATREALRYRTALAEGFQSLSSRPLTSATAVQICRRIKNTDIDIRRVPGTKLANPETREVIYTPPESESLLRDKLANWERFLHEATDLDPLVRMAVGHYQFEAIHPFTDGNGRTGRILNVLYLIEQDLLDLPVLYLSGYIIRNRADYYRLLLEVTSKANWEEWLLYMLEGVRDTAQWTAGKIQGIRRLMDSTAERVRLQAPAIYSHELVEQLFIQPYCRIGNLVEADIGHRETVSKYLKQLCDIGLLEEQKAGREKLFINTEFLKLLIADRM